MPRKIEFRAWVRKDKKMIGVKMIGGGYCWTDDVWLDSKTDLNATAHEIGVTCDVSEWTGLRDKHGNKIYEDDIVHWPGWDGKTYQVCYDRWGIPALAGIKTGEGGDFKEFEMQYNATPRKCEVLGNIYANPELLHPTP